MSETNLKSPKGERVELTPHPDACELEDLAELAQQMRKPLAVDLFCGAGGLSLGLEEAGFSVILGSDIDQKALETHRAHFGGTSLCADLSDPLVIEEISNSISDLQIDLVAAGPPCQPFSLAGRNKIRSLIQQRKRSAQDPRRELWRSVLDIVRNVCPKAVLVENVPDMALGNHVIILRLLVSELEQLGYEVHCRILSAWEHGVPQHRRRLFIVGLRPGTPFHWPTPNDNIVTVRDAISDLPAIEGGDFENPREYSHAETAFQDMCRRGLDDEGKFRLYDHITRAVRDDDLQAFQLMDSSKRYSELPCHLKRYRSDIFTDKYNRLDWEGLSRTITAHIAKDGYWYIHPEQHRTLSVREAARLQTFPDRFRFAGYRSNAFRQIGEAVPPVLARVLGTTIMNALHRRGRVRTRVSSLVISSTLSGWFDAVDEDEILAPWRRSGNLWHALLGIALFEKLNRDLRAGSWATYRDRWPEPRSFLTDTESTAALGRIGCEEKAGDVEKIACAVETQRTWASGAELGIKGLSTGKVAVAHALCGLNGHLPAMAVPLRVAGRVFGEFSRSRNMTDVNGRLLLARAVGTSEDGKAYGALLEIGEQFCHLLDPSCDSCPLLKVCRTGANHTQKQHQLRLT